MPDPVWLDTSVVHNALKGDAAINQQLTNYRKANRPLLVVPAVADELLNGNVVKGTPAPAPQFRQATQQGMARLGIKIDPQASKLPPGTKLKDLYTIGSDNVSLSDRRVLNQIKASAQLRRIAAPEMITAETGTKAMVSQASKWGIKTVPAARPAPGSVPAPPRVDLGEGYPAAKKGPISRFFNERPVLKKLGLIAANMAAEAIKGAIFAEVDAHFRAALSEARKEFEAKYPDPRQLKAKVALERYKQAYLAASSKLAAPSRANIAKTVILALTPDRDIARTKKYLDDQISKVQSAADGTRSGYAKVTEEYIDAMLALYAELNAYSGLGEIAADIRQRGEILDAVGRNLEETYQKYVLITGAFPFAYHVWMDVDWAAKEFMGLGGKVLSFASNIQAIYELALSIQKQLDEELIKVSEALAQAVP